MLKLGFKNLRHKGGCVFPFCPLPETRRGKLLPLAFSLLFIFCLLNATTTFAATVTLAWDAPITNEDDTLLTDLAGYRLYYGSSSGTYTQSIDINNASTTSYTVTNLSDNTTYYFAVTARDTSNNESAYSNEECFNSAGSCGGSGGGNQNVSSSGGTETGGGGCGFVKNDSGRGTKGQSSRSESGNILNLALLILLLTFLKLKVMFQHAIRGYSWTGNMIRITDLFTHLFYFIIIHLVEFKQRSSLNMLKMKIALNAVAVMVCLIAAISVAEAEIKNQVTSNGVTWQFSSPVEVGQFVNGDYYVVGPVTIISITPLPANGRNGSTLNPLPDQNRSGYDDRIPNGRYDASLRANLPISMKPGDVLVSSISLNNVGEIKSWFGGGDEGTPIKSYSVLTCLAESAPADAFRPSYADGYSKDLKIYRAGDLKRNLLPSLAYGKTTYKTEVGELPLSKFEDVFSRIWLDILFLEFDAPIEYMPSYPAQRTRVVGIATLILMTDLSLEQKEKLLIGVVQYGIDLWGLVRAGYPGWQAFGGHSGGRKWPIVFAGIMLGDPDMASPNKKYPNVKFGEDMHTMYGSAWTGANVVYTGHVGKDGLSGKIGWGAYEHLQPKDWPYDPNWWNGSYFYIGEDYRRCCTSYAWVAEALAGRIMQVEKYWNHDAFFDYVDRWMFEDDTEHIKIIKEQTGADYSKSWQRQRQTWDSFVMEMWSKYRNNLTPDSTRPSSPKKLKVK